MERASTHSAESLEGSEDGTVEFLKEKRKFVLTGILFLVLATLANLAAGAISIGLSLLGIDLNFFLTVSALACTTIAFVCSSTYFRKIAKVHDISSKNPDCCTGDDSFNHSMLKLSNHVQSVTSLIFAGFSAYAFFNSMLPSVYAFSSSNPLSVIGTALNIVSPLIVSFALPVFAVLKLGVALVYYFKARELERQLNPEPAVVDKVEFEQSNTNPQRTVNEIALNMEWAKCYTSQAVMYACFTVSLMVGLAIPPVGIAFGGIGCMVSLYCSLKWLNGRRMKSDLNRMDTDEDSKMSSETKQTSEFSDNKSPSPGPSQDLSANADQKGALQRRESRIMCFSEASTPDEGNALNEEGVPDKRCATHHAPPSS